jgi:hypothetical protein
MFLFNPRMVVLYPKNCLRAFFWRKEPGMQRVVREEEPDG